LSDGAPLNEALHRVIDNRTDEADVVRNAVKHWCKKTTVEKELGRTDAEIRKIGARRRPIEARAQRAICERVEELIQYCQNWLDLIAAEPRSLHDPRHQRADQCRELVQRALPPAGEEISSLEVASDAKSALAAAARFMGTALEDIARLFDETKEESTWATPVRMVLGAELLARPDVPLDVNWMPGNIAPARLLDILRTIADDPYDPSAAFQRQLEVDNHLGTARIIEHLEATGGDQTLIESLRAERKQALDECRRSLRRAIDETRRCVERAVCYDLVTEEERAEQVAMITDCEYLLTFDDDHDFGSDLRLLSGPFHN
jgi:hypothetical protein